MRRLNTFAIVIFNIIFVLQIQSNCFPNSESTDSKVQSTKLKSDSNVQRDFLNSKNIIKKETSVSLNELLGNASTQVSEPVEKASNEKNSKSSSLSTIETMSMSMAASGGVGGGSLPEKLNNNFAFDPYSGSSSINLPLFTFAGRKGVQPSLVLSYSHRNSNDVFGVGWGISLGHIERSVKDGIPTYTSSDKFFASLGGSSMELVSIGSGGYRSKIEGAFMKFSFDGTRWEARDKEGNIYYFGLDNILSDNSRVYSGTNVYRWYLSEIKDIHGNYIFVRRFADGSFEIHYTGEPGTDRNTFGSASQKMIFKVAADLETTNRQDKITSYRSGFEISKEKRISAINIYANDNLTRKYSLSYSYSAITGRSLLTSITEYGADGTTSMPSITFSYKDKNPSYIIQSITGDPAVGDKLWNARFDQGFDRGHDNFGDVPPYYFENLGQTYTKSSGDLGTLRWSINSNGSLYHQSNQDIGNYFWTYLYVKNAATLNIPYQTYESQVGFWLNGKYTTDVDRVWNLKAGYNLIEYTNYHQHQSIWFDLNCALANNVDIMSSTQVMNAQFAGDFNADGYSDTAAFFDDTGIVSVSLSNGSNFLPKSTWVSNFGVGQKLLLGNFNNDALTDAAAFSSSTGTFQIALSDGTKFTPNGSWLTGFGIGDQLSTGDFNGDGYTDLVAFHKSGGYLYAKFAINNKSGGFTVQTGININIGGENDIPFSGDFNADGLTDLAAFTSSSGNWHVRLNKGALSQGFLALDAVSGFGAGKNIVISDFNSDGYTDIGYYNDTTGVVYYKEAVGLGFGTTKQLNFTFNLRDTAVQVQSSDFNGDGLTDLIAFNPVGNIELAYSSGDVPDLLEQFNNGIGGVTKINYASTSQYQNMDLPFTMPVVSQVHVSNSWGDSYTTAYSYSDGLWDAAEREFLGFGKVRIIDQTESYTEMSFLQEQPYKGLPSVQAVYDSSNNLYSKIENTWNSEEIYAGVKFVYLARRDNYVFDGDSTGKRTAEEFYYEEIPQFGNLTKAVQLGQVNIDTGTDTGTDSRTVETAYVNNTTGVDWLIGLPRLITVKDNSSTVVRKTWFYYDNHDNTTAPALGLLTKKEDWNGQDEGSALNPKTLYSYNSYGNLLSTTDPRNYTTSITYDPVYNIFPLIIQNALTHQVTTTYYGVNGVPLSENGYYGLFGQVKSTTDSNNQTGHRVYDVFGRLVKTISPNDTLTYPTQTVAVDFYPNYVKTTVEKRINSGEAKTVKAVSFIDGLGRAIQSKTASFLANQYVVSGQTEYNSRGLVEKQYLPKFTSEGFDTITAIDTNGPKATVTYDGIGRAVQVTNPDLTYSSVIYNDWETSSINENGHKQSSFYDAYGRLIQRKEYLGADGRSANYPQAAYSIYSTTNYVYDSEGNLTQTIDNQSNTTTISYDNLGRKTSMIDPDMGAWSYEYDLNGNLVEQTDAKNQTIYFTYDELNRLTNKTDQSLLDVDYAYDDATSDYSIGRLNEVTYGTGNTEFNYDSMGREAGSTKTINGSSFSVERAYNALNQLLNVKYPDNSNIYYKYNDAGQIKAISNDPVLFELYSFLKSDYTNLKNYKYIEPREIKKQRPVLKNFLSKLEHFYDSFIEPFLGVSEAEASSLIPKKPASDPVITGVSASDQSVSLTWSAVSPVTYYVIKYGTQSETYTTTIRTSNTNTNYTISGLQNDTVYYFVVLGCNLGVYGPQSTQINAMPFINTAPQVNAGPDSQLTLPDILILNGTVTDDGYPNPPSKTTTEWSKISGPGTVTFNTTKSLDTTAVFSSQGIYVIALSANDGALSSRDELTVIVNPVVNKIPEVNAGLDQEITLPNDLILNASVSDDGYPNPPGVITTEWAMVSGSGIVTFDNYTSVDTIAHFSSAGIYVLKLTVDDGELNIADEITVTVNPNPAVSKFFVKNIEYNALGQMTHVEYGSGTITDYTYNSLNQRLTRIYTVNTSQVVLQDLNYTYDSVGNILSITDGVNTASQSFQYDDLNRLTSAAAPNSYGTKTFEYDEIGNITEKDGKSYTYGEGGAGPHAVTTTEGGGVRTTYTYDDNGNMLSKQVQGGGLVLYIYDVENRLIEVEKNGVSQSEFEYDGDGGRTRKIDHVNSISTKFIGSLYEEDTLGRETKYVFLGSQRIASITDGEVLYYHSDHLGGTNVLTNAEGSLKELIEYKPYGEYARRNRYGTDEEVARYYFTQHFHDDEVNLIFMNARYYDPELGRFLTADRIVPYPGNPQSFNRYGYCHNNPVNLIDPTGHFAWFVPMIIAAAKGAFIGACIGAGMAAITGGDIGRGALFGAIAGGVFSGVSSAFTSFAKFAMTGTSNISLIGNAARTVNILAGIVGGSAAGAAGAAYLGSDVSQGAGIGALSGGLFGGISQIKGTGWAGLGRVVAAGIAGGTISEISGGSFGEGAAFAGAIAGADFIYRTIVNTQPQGKNEGASLGTAPEGGHPKMDINGKPLVVDNKPIIINEVKYSNVGFSSRVGAAGLRHFLMDETGPVMSLLGKHGVGFQRFSLSHDISGNFFARTCGETFKNIFTNFETMPPLYGLNAAGSLINDNPGMIGIYENYIKNE